MQSGKLLIMGDFNIHRDDEKSVETKQFANIVKSYKLNQHINEPTHRDGHAIDFVITRTTEDIIESCKVEDMISDHHAAHTILKCSKPHPPRKLITFHKIKNIDITQM